MHPLIFDSLTNPLWAVDGSLEKPSRDLADVDQRIIRASLRELKEAVLDGDPLALRTLFERTGKKISEFYPFLPLETESVVRLQMLIESALAGHKRPIVILTEVANKGHSWAFYGLERLADLGIQRAILAFRRVDFNWVLAKRVLWRVAEYDARLEAYMEELGEVPSIPHLLLQLLPFEIREELERHYSNSAKDPLGTLGYMHGYLDLISDACDGVAGLDRSITQILRNAIEEEVLRRLEGQVNFKIQTMLFHFVVNHAAGYKWAPDSLLIMKCIEFGNRLKTSAL